MGNFNFSQVSQSFLTIRTALEALAGEGETWRTEIADAGPQTRFSADILFSFRAELAKPKDEEGCYAKHLYR